MTTHYMATIDGVTVTRSTVGAAYRYDRLEILDAVVTTKRAKPSKSKATK